MPSQDKLTILGQHNHANRLGRYVVLALAATTLILIPAISAWALLSLRAQAIADAEIQTSNLARAFSSQAARSIGEFAVDFNAVARLLTAQSIVNEGNEQVLHQLLQTFLAATPQIQNTLLVDANGTVVASSQVYPQPKIDVSDRPYFAHHQNDPALDIFFSPAVSGRVTQQDLVPVTRRIATPDGHFVGVLVTTLSPQYFTDFYSTVSLGEGRIIELLTDVGVVLARAPDGVQSVGKVTDTGTDRIPQGDQITTYRQPATSDEVERIASIAPVENYPLLLRVAVSMPDVLAAWRTQLYRQGSATILAMLGILSLTLVVLRQFGHLVESEAEVRRHAEVLNTTITTMADSVLVADEHKNIILSNPAAEQLLGLSSSMSPEQWTRKHHVFQADGVTPLSIGQSELARTLRGELVDHMEISLRRPDQELNTKLVVSGRPIRDGSGTLKGAVLVYRDVTEAQETERQLRQAQKMEAVGQLTGGIAHDFNNILTVITGTIEILAEAVEDRPQLAAVAKLIDEAAERGAVLTGQLLAFSRKQPLQPRHTDVNTLIMDAAKLLRPTLGEHVEIESMLEDEAWPALVDPNQFATALLNLALNARDAMPEGGKLTLETANIILDESYAKGHGEVIPGHYVMIGVSDTGSGIPASIRDRVFEPFFSTKSEGKGTGLGLSMVYGFVKQSEGHIKIYSEEGLGTTIRIYLPRAGAPADRTADAAPAVSIEGGHETILVVEDDALVRNYVNAQLHSLGYSTLLASNATEALTLIERGSDFDLLFTDVIMPGAMNGRQLAEAAVKLRPGIKVLYTSGYTENAIVHHGRLDPGVLLLPKPYRKADLARMIRTALSAELARRVNTLQPS